MGGQAFGHRRLASIRTALSRRVVPALALCLGAAAMVACEKTPENDAESAGGVVEVAQGAPQVCRDLAAQVRLTGLRETVREASTGRPLTVQAAVDTLQQAADEVKTAQRAADALTAWSSAPVDTARLDELAESFNALEKEVQAQCEFPLS